MAQLKEEQPTVVPPANRLDGKVAVITGGTRGIGLAVAKAYAREGAQLVIAARDKEELNMARDEIKTIGANVTAARVDLNSPQAAESLYTAAVRAFGDIDILVNNAGALGPLVPVQQYPVDEWTNVMRTNLDSVYWLTRAALGMMIPANRGSIINVISGLAYKGRANWGAYSVSKAAVLNLTQVLADELQPYHIRVNAINPGPTRTMMRAEAYPKEDPQSLPGPDDVVNPFIYLAADASKGVTGQSLEAKDWFGRSF